MLVIEGKVGKASVLQQKLKEWNIEETLTIDTIGNKLLENIEVLVTKDNVENIIEFIKKDGVNITNKYKRIILSVNCDKSYIFDIWKLEQELMKKYAFREIVVTVQNNELENIKIYEI